MSAARATIAKAGWGRFKGGTNKRNQPEGVRMVRQSPPHRAGLDNRRTTMKNVTATTLVAGAFAGTQLVGILAGATTLTKDDFVII